MSVRFTHACGQEIETAGELIGKRCPRCGQVIVAAAPAGQAPAEPDEERIRVECPHCGASHRGSRLLLGRQRRCKSCGNDFVVTEAPEQAPEPQLGADMLWALARVAEHQRQQRSKDAVVAVLRVLQVVAGVLFILGLILAKAGGQDGQAAGAALAVLSFLGLLGIEGIAWAMGRLKR
jgi:predicted RNA-binding Zn-ribbon protein involved in translation (DUF1610 family)